MDKLKLLLERSRKGEVATKEAMKGCYYIFINKLEKEGENFI
jgi:hypothetical protein